MLTYSLTWQADRCTSRRMAFKALLNTKARPFPNLCSSFLCAYRSKKLPERAPTKKQVCVLSIIDQLCAWAHRRSAYAQLSPFLYPYVTHVINYSRPSPAFPYWKRWKAGRGLGTRIDTPHTKSSMITIGMRPLSPVLCDRPHPQSSFRRLNSTNTSPGTILQTRVGIK